MKKLFATNSDIILLILRIFLGIVFFPHGAQKVFGWFGGHGFSATVDMFSHMGVPAFLAVLAILAEFLGALGLLVGLLTRIAAFGIFCNMLVAVIFVHAPNGFFMNWTGQQGGEGFEFHLLVIAIALALMIRGAGPYSLDRLIARS